MPEKDDKFNVFKRFLGPSNWKIHSVGWSNKRCSKTKLQLAQVIIHIFLKKKKIRSITKHLNKAQIEALQGKQK